jgi:excisionase family DNA binding protein
MNTLRVDAMSLPPIQPLFKTDIAERLGVSIRTVENLVRRGEIPPPATIGGRVLWHPDVFNKWLDQRLRTSATKDTHEALAGESAEQPIRASPTGKDSSLRRKLRAGQLKLNEDR